MMVLSIILFPNTPSEFDFHVWLHSWKLDLELVSLDLIAPGFWLHSQQHKIYTVLVCLMRNSGGPNILLRLLYLNSAAPTL